jgi:hypothetical protein
MRRPALQSYKLQRCASASSPCSRASSTAAPLRCASETGVELPPVSDLLESLPLELRDGCYSARYGNLKDCLLATSAMPHLPPVATFQGQAALTNWCSWP